jgi:hypothetical protein
LAGRNTVPPPLDKHTCLAQGQFIDDLLLDVAERVFTFTLEKFAYGAADTLLYHLVRVDESQPHSLRARCRPTVDFPEPGRPTQAILNGVCIQWSLEAFAPDAWTGREEKETASQTRQAPKGPPLPAFSHQAGPASRRHGPALV